MFGQIRDVTLGDGGAYSVANFLQVPIAPLYSFDLLSVAPGSFSPATCFVAAAAGQTCTPAGNTGPTVFNLANTLNANGGIDATISFNVAGVDAFAKQVLRGVIIVAAVALYAARSKRFVA